MADLAKKGLWRKQPQENGWERLHVPFTGNVPLSTLAIYKDIEFCSLGAFVLLYSLHPWGFVYASEFQGMGKVFTLCVVRE